MAIRLFCGQALPARVDAKRGNQGFNSPGLLEVPEDAFEELLVNALVHRDYFVSTPIRLLIFSDRVEIISPGHLPNHLDVEQIRFGISNLRNPALASHAFYILLYRGIGSGIPRALATWRDIEFSAISSGLSYVARQAVICSQSHWKMPYCASWPKNRPVRLIFPGNSGRSRFPGN